MEIGWLPKICARFSKTWRGGSELLKELFCSMGDASVPIQDELVADVTKLVAATSVSGTDCKPKKY